MLNVTDCIISFCIVLLVTTSTLYLNKIETRLQDVLKLGAQSSSLSFFFAGSDASTHTHTYSSTRHFFQAKAKVGIRRLTV